MSKRGKLRSAFSKEKLVVCILALMIAIFSFFYYFNQNIWQAGEAPFEFKSLVFGLALFLIFYGLDKLFKIEFENKHYVFMGLIALGSYILGPLYHVYFYYDKFLHFTQSLLLSGIIFHMLKRLRIKKKWALLITIFIVVGVGSMFELTEFGIDRFYGMQTQGVFLRSLQGHVGQLVGVMDPLIDTDLDMLFNLLGSITFSVIILALKFFRNSRLKDVEDFLHSGGA